MSFAFVATTISLVTVSSLLYVVLLRGAFKNHEGSNTRLVRRRLFARLIFWVSISTLMIHMIRLFAPVEIMLIWIISMLIPVSAVLIASYFLPRKLPK